MGGLWRARQSQVTETPRRPVSGAPRGGSRASGPGGSSCRAGPHRPRDGSRALRARKRLDSEAGKLPSLAVPGVFTLRREEWLGAAPGRCVLISRLRVRRPDTRHDVALTAYRATIGPGHVPGWGRCWPEWLGNFASFPSFRDRRGDLQPTSRVLRGLEVKIGRLSHKRSLLAGENNVFCVLAGRFRSLCVPAASENSRSWLRTTSMRLSAGWTRAAWMMGDRASAQTAPRRRSGSPSVARRCAVGCVAAERHRPSARFLVWMTARPPAIGS